MAKVQVINVFEVLNGVVNNIHSFTNDDEGKQEAETLFCDILREQLKDKDIDDDFGQDIEAQLFDVEYAINEALTNGYYDDDNGYVLNIMY